MTRNLALSLAVFTLFVFPLVGMLLVNIFTEESISIMIRSRSSVLIQLGIGVGVGLVMGLICLFISNRDFIQRSPRVQEIKMMMRGLKLSLFDIVLISIAVGFGEELFFRGALQFIMWSTTGSMFFSVIFTAVLFVAIHKYISFKDWRITVYGVVMTVLIIIVGFMTEQFGIWSAAAAHAMIDFVLLASMDSDEPLSHIPVWDEEE